MENNTDKQLARTELDKVSKLIETFNRTESEHGTAALELGKSLYRIAENKCWKLDDEGIKSFKQWAKEKHKLNEAYASFLRSAGRVATVIESARAKDEKIVAPLTAYQLRPLNAVKSKPDLKDKSKEEKKALETKAKNYEEKTILKIWKAVTKNNTRPTFEEVQIAVRKEIGEGGKGGTKQSGLNADTFDAFVKSKSDEIKGAVDLVRKAGLSPVHFIDGLISGLNEFRESLLKEENNEQRS